MSCPNIYLGTNRFGARPLAAEYGNDAIILSSYDVTLNTTVAGQLRVNNHGTDNSPSSHVELYWSDPATNFAALPSRRILNPDLVIPGAAVGGSDGESLLNWTYSFPTAGHFCLLARLSNNSPPTGAGCTSQAYDSSSPPTDPQSAIHNINVIAPPPPAPGGGAGGGGAGGGAGARQAMGFAFAAVNMQRDVEKTALEIQVLDPAKDRERLQRLVSLPGLHRTLARRHVKFAVPNGLRIGEGRERVMYRSEHFDKDAQHCCVPRMATGEVNAPHIQRLLNPGSHLVEPKGSYDLHLLHGEARQMFIQVEPCNREHVAYAVEVTHLAGKRNIGGLVCIFVPPHDYF